MAKARKNEFQFTDKRIEKLPLPAKRVTYVDAEEKYLRLQVFPSGTKTFYFVRRIDRNIKWHKIAGAHMPVEEARKICRKLATRVDEGKPIVSAKNERKGEPTLGELFDAYISKKIKPKNELTAEDYGYKWAHVPERMRRMKIVDLQRSDFTDLHADIWNNTGLSVANRLVQVVRGCINWGILDKRTKAANPLDKFPQPKENSRARFLSQPEVHALFDALNNYHSQIIIDLIKVALFTGQRRANCQAMKWADLDLHSGRWHLNMSEMKQKDHQIVHLPKPVIEILERRKQHATCETFVFPGRGKTGHIVEPKRAWNAIKKTAGIRNFHFHDLRRTLGSWLAANGVSLEMIAKQLGHKDQRTTKIYARLPDDVLVGVVDNVIDKLLGAGGN